MQFESDATDVKIFCISYICVFFISHMCLTIVYHCQGLKKYTAVQTHTLIYSMYTVTTDNTRVKWF